MSADRRAARFDGRLFAGRFSTVLLVAAGLLAAWPPVTQLYAHHLRTEAQQGYTKLERSFRLPTPTPSSAANELPAPTRFGPAAASLRKQVRSGDPIARIRIPRIGLRATVVQGSPQLGADGFDSTLRAGPAHLATTPLPGEGANVFIAGHRTTFTHPFWNLQRLRPGDRITLEVPYGRFEYRVRTLHVVKPTDTAVTRPGDHEVITLSTCTPRFTAQSRLIVVADLLRVRAPARAQRSTS